MAATTPVEESLDVVRKSVQEVFNGRDYAKHRAYTAEDVVLHDPSGEEIRGVDASLENMKGYHAAFSDLEATEELAFSDGEHVCSLYTYRGTHDGEFMGLPPTGVEAEVKGVSVDRVEDGKIAESWVVVDFLGLLQQVGAVPSADELGA